MSKAKAKKTAKAKRTSGGGRDTLARRQERDARRAAAGYDAHAFLVACQANPPPSLSEAVSSGESYNRLRRRFFAWLADRLLGAVHDASCDVGPPPEVRREQIGRLGLVALKTLDPSTMSVAIRQLEEALERVTAARGAHQASEPSLAPGVPS